MSNYNIGQTSLSFLSSILPNSTANTIIGASILTAATALIIRHISPTRMTRLVTLMHETNMIYIHAIEAGLVSSDVDADALFKNSLSTRTMLAEILQDRSLVLYCCIRDVQDLKTQIEISKEVQLRNLNPIGVGTAA
ncbi:hypothetical protein C8J57DRAFT_1237972 [Mycena rebaudengoi]|nr:hypothetical protein C8J57DRAFT_1237972 [Mycena rebaudengoi]